MQRARSVAVVGGGPAGLMAAEILSAGNVRVDLYDAMPSVGRKLLMAGKGGLNITHSEPLERFLSRYGARRAEISPLLADFGPDALRAWLDDLGIGSFIGTSRRIFPTDMKAAPLLRAWLHRLRAVGVKFHMRHNWQGWGDAAGGFVLRFATSEGEILHRADAMILALGGGSWPRLGSNGAWAPLLARHGVPVAPLRPANSGFDTGWTEHFRTRFAGHPVKPVTLECVDATGTAHRQQGEVVITENGIEGGLVYALSAPLRDEIAAKGSALVYLDLAPGRDLPSVVAALSQPRGKESMANFLRKRIGLSGVRAGLLRELAPPADFADAIRLGPAIKRLPLRLDAPRPLAEAISSAGGVAFEALDARLMVRALPGLFCAGEMLDWEAPTGGYLLTACFASGRAAGKGALAWLEANGASQP